MQRGVCWMTLGRPDKAVSTLDAAAVSLPAVYRRDRAVAMSHQAAGLAAVGEPAQAAETAVKALEIAHDCGSGRILQMIAPLAAELAAHSQVEQVVLLRAALAGKWAV